MANTMPVRLVHIKSIFLNFELAPGSTHNLNHKPFQISTTKDRDCKRIYHEFLFSYQAYFKC